MSDLAREFLADLWESIQDNPKFYGGIVGGYVLWAVVVLTTFTVIISVKRKQKIKKDQALVGQYAVMAARIHESYPT